MEGHIIKNIPWFLVSLSLILKLTHINTFPIQLDEPFSIFTSNLAWPEFWKVFLTENNPPLHPILLKFVIEIFGMDEFWMRLLSVMLSSFSVYFIYKSGEIISGWKTGLIAGLIFCFSNLQMAYSHQIRAYALMVLLSSISIYLIIKLLKEKNNNSFILLGIINALLLYTHFMGIVHVGLSGLALIVFFKDKWIVKNLFYSYGITLLLFSPYLPIFLDRLLWVNGDSWVESPSSPMSIYFIFWRFFNAPLTTITGILTILSGLIFFKRFTENRDIISLLYAVVICTFIGLYFTSLKLPIYVDRYLIFVTPVLYPLIAVIISTLSNAKSNVFNWGLTLLLPILFMATFKIKSDIGQDKTTTWKIINEIADDKIVVFSPAWNDANYCYHTNKELYFTDSKIKFDSLRKQDGIFKNYELVDTWKINATGKRVIVSLKNGYSHTDFDKILNEHFVVVQQLSNELWEYRVK